MYIVDAMKDGRKVSPSKFFDNFDEAIKCFKELDKQGLMCSLMNMK